jgi:hypothetical protein
LTHDEPRARAGLGPAERVRGPDHEAAR